MSEPLLLLIVPCYNEEKRIDLEAFSQLPAHIHILFADDGSTDGTKALLGGFCKSPQYSFYSHFENVGKANVIYHAFQSLKQDADLYTWIGYWDADLATPLGAIDQMLSYLSFYPDREISAIWGSRISRLGSEITRQAHRHYLGRIFVTLTSLCLGVKAYDSQCGAKLFRSQAAEKAFSAPFISRWIFDIEILLRLREHEIVEFPLLRWKDIPGSKVKVFREALRVLFDIYRIRKSYLKN